MQEWDTLTAKAQRLCARQAEGCAGFLAQTASASGRFVTAIEDSGAMDDTLFLYIAGDHGTSAAGGMVGLDNERTYGNGVAEQCEALLPLLDPWGGPATLPHMAAGWAVACAEDGGGRGQGGTGTLRVNGTQVAEGRIDTTQPLSLSADETAAGGLDTQTPVAEGLGKGTQTRFTGKIAKVTVEVQ